MKDTIVSIFFSNGDVLKIDTAGEIRQIKPSNGMPRIRSPENTERLVLYTIQQKKRSF